MSTFTSRAWATIKAVMLAESASPSAGTDPATKDYVDNLVVTRHETLTAPAAGGTNIAVQATDDIDTTTFSAQPDYPRNIAVTFGANWPATVHVYVEGKGADGETLKEIIQASQGTTVNGVEAFAVVTRYFTTEGTSTTTATPTTDSVTAGVGVAADLKLAAAASTVFGVAAKGSTVSFYKLHANGADEAIAANTPAKGTFRPTTVPNGSKHFHVWYRIN